VKDQGPIQSGSRSSGGACSAGVGEGTLVVHDRSRLATIRDRGLREIAALGAHNRAFGEACNAYYASGKVAAPFESLNEEYWT
jgi:hypothetical protein